MNKTLQSLFCFSAVAVMFCSCVKEEPEANMSPRAAVKLRAVFADSYSASKSGAKAVVDNSTLTPAFLDGDKVWVSGETFTADVDGSNFTLTGSAVVSPYAAVYPYDCVDLTTQGESTGFPVALTLPAEQAYDEDESGNQIINAPMAALAETEPTLEFKNVCSLVRVRVRNNMDKGTFTLSSITLTASSAYLSGPASITESAGSFSLAVGSGSHSVTLTGLSEIVEENKSSKDYYIYIPPVSGEGTQFTVVANVTFKKLAMKYTFQYETEATNVTIEQSRVGAISMLLNSCQVLDFHPAYYFSVAADKQVYFSPGNLQWCSTSTHSVNDPNPLITTGLGTWRFAEEQWISYGISEYAGNLLSQSQAQSSPLWSDLFRWGTSGWDNGNSYYYPYNRIYTNNSGIGYGYGPKNGSAVNLPLTDDYAYADWGVYNAISNGGNTPGIWRTLTKDEWTYVVTSRSNRRSFATVNGVTGLVLLPDDWVLPAGSSISLGNVNASTNVYTVEQWRKLEENGAIFLPTTGYINTGKISATDIFVQSALADANKGYYYSSTNYGNYNAYCLKIEPSSPNLNTSNYQYRYYGLAVRLVRDKN